MPAVKNPNQATYPNSSWPSSTYRLQFHAGFTFRQAAEITPYLQSLGISHVYASPYFKATPGSTHGYDVIDHQQLNPELGSLEDYQHWVGGLKAAGISHLLDTVPNHVGVATNHNAWWNDVLEHGPAASSGDYFDISWRASPRPQMHDKVLLPVLGDPYAQALEQGKLKISFSEGRFTLHYFERQFPLDPRSYAAILALGLPELLQLLGPGHPAALEYQSILTQARGLPDRSQCAPEAAAIRRRETLVLQRRLGTLVSEANIREILNQTLSRINGRPGDALSFDPLDGILQDQCYRLAYWHVASDEINYRRFFDINDLAALRMENDLVFAATHRLLFDLIRQGAVTGLRIDHPDGLFDPKGYFEKLQDAYRESRPREASDRPLYVVAEKILAAGEPLRENWPIAGTSGYDFLNMVSGLFVDPDGLEPLTALYQQFTRDRTSFADLAYAKKKLILELALASELQMLTHRLDLLAQRDRHSRDFTLHDLRTALQETIACFPVYRTYITGQPIATRDREEVDTAIRTARERNLKMSSAVFDFLRRVILLEFPGTFTEEDRQLQIQWVGRFQQLTSPVTAKGIEDTAFYIYHRLVSLNEVGGDPNRFGILPSDLHAYFQDRQTRWPAALSCLSTHDTKRSEDIRARIHVLSEIPEQWQVHVTRWREANGTSDQVISSNDEYLLYQTLLGAWPLESLDAESRPVFIKRIQAYMQKAMREAKTLTSWTDPNQPYEAAVAKFVADVLHAETSRAFLDDFQPFQQYISHVGMFNSLSQALLRLTAPGAPDTYQGTEFWDFSLVDPDNRRPVDYALRRRSLEDLQKKMGACDRLPLVQDLLQFSPNGRIKLFLTHAALACRRQYPGLFTQGNYFPTNVTGPRAANVFAFARRFENHTAIVAVPRLLAHALAPGQLPLGESLWGNTALHLPNLPNAECQNYFTNETLRVASSSLPIAHLFNHFPVALLIAENKSV